MKKITFLTKILLFTFFVNHSFSQRYLTEVFTDVKITDDVEYGQNIEVLSGSPLTKSLRMTVYEPDNDTTTTRPLFIYVHTGSFLPKNTNGQPTGARSDSAVVEICTRLAKRGYVVAAISYRLGWNPIDPDDDARKGALLRAVYRSIQDTKTAIRFFRKNAATLGNTYGIDQGRIAVIGQGSGGYVAFACASLDKLTEIQLTKFYDFTNNEPYVDPSVLGDFEGFGGLSVLNIENHTGYSSEVNLAVNLGGAMGDSTWLEAGDIPMISFHCVSDPFAPYATGTVIVPTTGAIVLEDAAGSYTVQKLTNMLNNNDVFVSASFSDVFTTRANSINDGYEGLFPFVTSNVQGAPWEWWSASEPTHTAGLATNPDMSKSKAVAYIDTILGYISPRAKVALVDAPALSTSEQIIQDITVNLFPNPANNQGIKITSNELIQTIEIKSLSGQLIHTSNTINNLQTMVSTENLVPGIYFVSIKTLHKTISQKLIINN